jgi:hypothetical protein
MADLIVTGLFSADSPGFVPASGGSVLNFLRADGSWVAAGGLSDGDYGDIIVGGTGTTMTIDNGVVTTAKLGGDITTAGKALLDDANAAAQRTTLGLGTAAVENVGAFEAAGAVATHAAVTQTHGITAFGASLVDDLTAGDARTTLGLAAVAASGSASDLGSGTLPIARIGANAIDGTKIFRGATSGHVLTSNGAGADPTYQPGGGPGGAPTYTAFAKNLGTARRSGTFDITGLSGLTADKFVDIRQTAAAITSKGSARDEGEMDSISLTGYVVDATTIRAFWNATGVVVGDYQFAYLVSG